MSPRRQAADRLRRVVALVPYIAARGEAEIPELAAAFGVDEREIRGDLEVLPFCGLPPYTPDRLIDVSVVDDAVSIRFAEYFERPLRLTPAEGFTLLAAGRALLDVPGSDPAGPLASALDKLEAALGAHEVVDVDIGEAPEVERLRAAADRRERIEIEYYSFGRDAMTTRRVDPYAVSSLRGNWYLAARCHLARDDRLFRVDRIHGIRETGERFEPPSGERTPADVFSPGPGDEEVVLDLPASAEWVAESYPTDDVEVHSGGRLRVTLRVAAVPWLERVLLRAGPDARVVSPASWGGTGPAAAARILDRYRSGAARGP